MTLVEILVVVSIIALLMGLLLPAVQSVRESGRRSRCSNNLRQFGAALLHYHNRFERLPANSRWDGTGSHRKGSMHVALLPELEQQNFYDQLNMEGDVVAQIDGHDVLRKAYLQVMRCTSDDFPRQNDAGQAVTNYAPSVGAQKTYGRCSRYSGNRWGTGPNGDGNWYGNKNGISGPFARHIWAASMAEIPDGASNTILMGEILPGCSTHLLLPWWHGQQYFVGTAPPINFPTCPDEPPGNDGNGDICNNWSNWNTDVGFKSRHSGGAGFVLGDGSVRFLKQTIDYDTFQRVGCRRDATEANGGVLVLP